MTKTWSVLRPQIDICAEYRQEQWSQSPDELEEGSFSEMKSTVFMSFCSKESSRKDRITVIVRNAKQRNMLITRK